MNKAQAAEYLGVTVRTLQRYTAQGKIEARSRPIKTGSETVYDEAEVDRFKRLLDKQHEAPTRFVRPMVEESGDRGPTSSEMTLTRVRGEEGTVLFGDFTGMGFRVITLLEDIQARLPPALPAAPVENTRSVSPEVPVENKIMLTVAEAATLSNLSRKFLTTAIKEGKLKGKVIGRGYKIKRADLDAYVKKL